jgi:hypothetical protein
MAVMSELDEAGRPSCEVTGNLSAGVAALSADLSGVWEVCTRTSTHIWDLDQHTYTRLPGAGGAAMPGDGTPHRITQVQAWPEVGTYSYVVFDDPQLPDLIEQWRQSGTCLSIRRVAPPAL